MADDSAKKFNVNKLASDYVVDGKSGREISREARETMESSVGGNRMLGAEEARRERGAGIDFLQNVDFAVGSTLVDGSDAKANAGFTVSFMHVPSENEVYFKAFLTAFNETFKPEWAQETVYGRADPIYMYKNTQRSISVGLMIPAATQGEGFENMGKLQKLIQFLYPTYVDADNALTITQSPLVRLKVMNIASKVGSGRLSGQGSEFDARDYSEMINSNNAGDGLLGVVQNLTINYNISELDVGSFEVAPGTLVPKGIEINFDFSVVHEHHLGWDENSNFSEPNYPYDLNLEGALEDAQTIARKYAMAEARKAREEAAEQLEKIAATAKAEQERRDNTLTKIGRSIGRVFSPKATKKERAYWDSMSAATEAYTAAEARADAYESAATVDAQDYGSASDVYTDFID